jgi:cyanate permease
LSVGNAPFLCSYVFGSGCLANLPVFCWIVQINQQFFLTKSKSVEDSIQLFCLSMRFFISSFAGFAEKYPAACVEWLI